MVHRIDASGNVLKTYDYNAFGNELGMEPLDTNPFRYCGEYFDRETGTYYLRARNYEPSTGRFTTEDVTRSRKTNIFDPTGVYQDTTLVGGVFRDEEQNRCVVEDPLGLNLYTYCQNSPVRYSDATGNFIITASIATIATGVFALFTVALADPGIQRSLVATAEALWQGVSSVFTWASKYQKPANPNRRKGAEDRGPDADAPGKNEEHGPGGQSENHSQKPKGSHGMPKGHYNGGR